MLNVVLVEPEIPANTGNIGRTCVVTGTRLHLIKPLGFSLDDKSLKRAGMAYWQSLDVRVYDNWDEFITQNIPSSDTEVDCMRNNANVTVPQLHFLTKKARKTYVEGSYCDGDFIIFGKESSGLPEHLLAQHALECERIPMLTDDEALVNGADWSDKNTALTWEGTPRTHEALLAQDICGNFINPEEYHVSALNLSNAAAIVLYEALRQINFVTIQN
ncbi:tRNA (cytidine(34)-2'-O)-methyltransferase [Atopobium fossor]|uniref:tRNA (cytidine(34)-2'-O)-methyltransferase n=1 Tax=Atopobium fossor TaxID=39487 RepID=UPI000429C124|nr:tRNA (cytidine(34)-2'-O)-methyltransferase [Atopobium fossor]